VTSRAVGRTLRAAWLEYQDIRDGIVFMHASTTRLGFENALAKLPAGPGGKSTRAAGNMSDMKIKVRTHKQGEKTTFAAFIAQPSESHAVQLQKWINSPAVKGADLVDDPAAPDPIDWLVISGHGSGGSVWGDGSGDHANIEVASSYIDGIGNDRSGRLKCVMLPCCNNVNKGLAGMWLSLFDHAKPLHVLLGYEYTYSGGATGAHVMARFVDKLVKDRKMPIIEAWRAANKKSRQPWAALAAKGGEKLNLDDWVNDRLPALKDVKDLLHFSEDHPGGEVAKLSDERYDLSWVMADGTVLDMTNNGVGHPKNGLFDGKAGKIRIKALKPEHKFVKGKEGYIAVHLYRPTKPFVMTDLLKFDKSLTDPHAATGKPVLTPEKGRTNRPENTNDVDAFRIVFPADGDTLELGFTINSDATKKFKNDGPGGTHGRFLLEFVPTDNWVQEPDFFYWFDTVYPAAGGALLRK
jgi:hypothetical protein